MRAWFLSAALVSLVALGLPGPMLAAAPATPTPVPAKPAAQAPAKPQAPAATPTKPPSPADVPTSVPWPTAAPKTQAAVQPAPAQQAPVQSAPKPAPPPPTPTPEPTKAPTRAPTPTAVPTQAPVLGAVAGRVFLDADGDTSRGLAGVDVILTPARGAQRTTRTTADGRFAFEGLAPGAYHVAVQAPADRAVTTGTAVDVEVGPDGDSPVIWFGLGVPKPEGSETAAHEGPAAEEPGAEAAPEQAAASEQDQIAALSAISSLPLRFAEGRDLMQQVTRRVLGNGLVWLGVPFRSQIDGGTFQYVNCGPASLTMVLAAFGLEVGPSQVRDYLNQLIDNYDTDLGTSLDVLGRISREAGLTAMDLYSSRGGYRNWSTEAVRWHVQQGHPVITLVKYRLLPGHGQSVSEFDHYIVISGLTPDGFIYNDAAFASTLGYGLEISDAELEVAWDNTSIPHHAVALGLAPQRTALSFPEAPRPTVEREAAGVRSARQQAEADEAQAERPRLTLTPVAGVPLITTSDRWMTEEDFDAVEPGGPMGLTFDHSDEPALEARPGPGRLIPTVVGFILAAWLLLGTWSLAGRLVRLRPARAVLAALLGLVRP